MFTGIIETIGKIKNIEKNDTDARFLVQTSGLDLTDVAVGDSICVNGVCLTVTSLPGDGFWTDVSGETLMRTTLSDLEINSPVNLEKSLLPTTRMGGHLVSGHVDGVGEVMEKNNAGRSVQFQIQVPETLAKYIAEKGSVCIDGVSLTINRVVAATLEINIIPHTLQETIIGTYAVGQNVNIEVDIIARYLERLLIGDSTSESMPTITLELLKRHGYTG